MQRSANCSKHHQASYSCVSTLFCTVKVRVLPHSPRTTSTGADRHDFTGQVTSATNTTVGCRYFLPRQRLPSQLQSVTMYRFLLFGEQKHVRTCLPFLSPPFSLHSLPLPSPLSLPLNPARESGGVLSGTPAGAVRARPPNAFVQYLVHFPGGCYSLYV